MDKQINKPSFWASAGLSTPSAAGCSARPGASASAFHSPPASDTSRSAEEHQPSASAADKMFIGCHDHIFISEKKEDTQPGLEIIKLYSKLTQRCPINSICLKYVQYAFSFFHIFMNSFIGETLLVQVKGSPGPVKCCECVCV